MTDNSIRKMITHTIDTLPVPWEQLWVIFRRVIQLMRDPQKAIEEKTENQNESKKVIEEGAMFCPNCGQGLQMGAQVVSPVFASKNNIKTGSKSLSKKKIAALAVAGVVVIVAVSAFSNRRTVIDMNDVYEIIIGGHDGTGIVTAIFNPDEFMEKYEGKITLDKESAKKWCKKEYDSIDDAKEAYEELCSYDDVTSHFCDILDYCGSMGPAENNGRLKNGDIVEFVNDYEDTFDTLEEVYHCKFKKLKNYKVDLDD